ncbi:Uncharacterised protein [Amycolatopsis camponoti]|uniref:Uncharacterized protein n=1 Tax=Amycolatopsis camponoti TaxID=2606593 RepID=A0A6I8M200_9PSEU|nr:hypothetical protein [Amycolatopsis camponoti]VVJ22692.1 Uncharacterised protein [Amycolatopsis camponoti]
MSTKNRKTRTAATDVTDSDRHLQAVPEQHAQQTAVTANDKVRAALADNPGATTAALAIAAGVGRSTAAKVLASWGRDGSAVRTAGDGPRNPDTWTLAVSDNAAPAGDATDTPTDVAASPDPSSGTDETGTRPDTTDTHAVPGDDPSNEPESTTGVPTDASDADGQQPSDEKIVKGSPAAPHGLGTDVDAATPPPDPATVAPVPDTNVESDEPASTTSTDKTRLPKGGLRAMVEEYLTEHPHEDFGPAKIGKELSRSGGAVNNALEKLVADGYAIKTCEAPKRFKINPDKVDVSPTTDSAG